MNGNIQLLRVLAVTLFWVLLTTAGTVAAGGLEKADQLFGAGKFGAARDAYTAALAGSPDKSNAMRRLGEIALLHNKPATAKRHLVNAIAINNEDTKAKKLLAEAHYRRNEFHHAAALHREAGNSGIADKLASFKNRQPYKITGEKSEPIRFIRTDPLPLVSVKLNDGELVNFIIDTGGGELIVDSELAKSMGIPTFGQKTAKFGGDKKGSYDHGRVDRVQLGYFIVENVPVHVMSTRRFSAAASGKRVDGILGTILLSQFRFTLDYPQGALLLERKSSPQKTQPTDSVPFWLAGDHLILAWGQANQAPPVLMLIDTGLAGGGFTCPQSTMKAAGFKTGDQSFEGIGGGGTMTVTPFFAEKLTLGDTVKKNVMSFFGPFPESLEHRYGFPIQGLLSHNFFRDHAVTFDFENMQIYLKQ